MNADGDPALFKLKSFTEHNAWSKNSKYTHKSPNYTRISLFSKK